MKAPFQLHEDLPSQDTIAYFRDMLDRAERGEVLGGSGAWMLKGRQFVTHTIGETNRNPVYAIGMLVVLIVKLVRRVLK